MCTPTKANGATCASSNECTLGNCVGSICCESACTATCNSCGLTDTGLANGLCRPIKSGGSSKGKCPVDPVATAPCGRDGTCDGSGACHFVPATTSCGMTACTSAQLRAAPTCNGTGSCITPTATMTCQGGVVCASTTACKAASCTADTDCTSNFCVGTTCTPKKANGQSCAAARECTSNMCVDGVCCNTACTGSCEFCNASATLAGTCSLVTGAPRTGHTPCTGTAPCASSCTGTTAACVFPPAGTSCRSAGCASAVATRAATCNADGSCPGVSIQPCSPFACNGSACGTNCTTNAGCVTGAACVAGACSVCVSGLTVCPNACANLTNDPQNCGACGYSCLGGPCQGGVCLPLTIGMTANGVIVGALAVNSTTVFTGDDANLYAVPKSKASGAPIPLLSTIATVPSSGGGPSFIAANDSLLMVALTVSSRAGVSTALYSCSPAAWPPS